jgi:2'-5' RNA ligase
MTQAEPLCQIATELDTALIAQGFPTESRTFQPHLTLLRVKSRPPEDLFTLLSQESHTDFGRVVISHLELIESQLAHGGARYATLAKFALGP